MPDAAPSQTETPRLDQPGVDASRIALEVARVLRESGFAAPSQRPQQWISLEEAAETFGYSVSRFYHVYKHLGLVPSRASKRKLRFHRQEIEDVLRDRQRTGRGRPHKNVTREQK